MEVADPSQSLCKPEPKNWIMSSQLQQAELKHTYQLQLLLMLQIGLSDLLLSVSLEERVNAPKLNRCVKCFVLINVFFVHCLQRFSC